jgi:hypothetical protein
VKPAEHWRGEPHPSLEGDNNRKVCFMKVYVKSQSGKWLMPTNPANARILLKNRSWTPEGSIEDQGVTEKQDIERQDF